MTRGALQRTAQVVRVFPIACASRVVGVKNVLDSVKEFAWNERFVKPDLLDLAGVVA